MKILISGGAGFIGSHIQDAYLALGHEVAVMDNLSSGQRANLNPKATFYEMDIRGKEAAEAIRDFKPELLNHHAAQMDVRKSVTDPVYDCEVNGMGLLNLLESGRNHGLKKVVFASSGGAVYGEQECFPAGENHPTNPASPYGITKLLGDKYLQFYQHTHGIDFVSLRYANVYGPRQNPHGEAGVVAIFTTKLLDGNTPLIYGDGLQTRDYVYVQDVVQANILALQEDARGIYNIGTGIETNVLQVYETLARLLKRSAEAAHGPAKPGEQRRSVISYGKIEKELGWRPRFSLEQGLGETVEYFKKQFHAEK